MNKVEELLKTCEERIGGLNWRFLRYGFWNELEKIKSEVVKGINIKKLDEDDVEAFTKICDNRLDRIKSFSRNLITVISISAASLAITASILIEKIIKAPEANEVFYRWFPGQLLDPMVQIFPVVQWIVSEQEPDWLGMKIVMFVLFIVIVVLAPLIAHYWGQAHAWYAIKEGALLSYAKRRRKRKAKHR